MCYASWQEVAMRILLVLLTISLAACSAPIKPYPLSNPAKFCAYWESGTTNRQEITGYVDEWMAEHGLRAEWTHYEWVRKGVSFESMAESLAAVDLPLSCDRGLVVAHTGPLDVAHSLVTGLAGTAVGYAIFVYDAPVNVYSVRKTIRHELEHTILGMKDWYG